MWEFSSEKLSGDCGLQFKNALNSTPATFADVLRAWREQADFRQSFNNVLALAPYSAFRWETPPVTSATLERPFEFVLLKDTYLSDRPDTRAFAEHWKNAPSSGIVEFSNLGGDAILVVPCPLGPPKAYVHLASFVRQAPPAQRDALWQSVAAALSRRVSAKPLWLSTAGAGVAWLHVRLDDRPKYYRWEPYTSYS